MTSKRVFLGRVAAAAILGLVEITAGIAMLLPSGGPAAAQLFERRPQGGFPFFPFFESQPRREWRQAPGGAPSAPAAADFSRAPAPPRKADAVAPTTNVVVLGDSMADWLAYGLEDAFADTPEIGILRKHKTYSGLIRYDSRRDAQEWPQVAREILAAEKPSFVVVMLGLSDRQSLRDRVAAKPVPGQKPGPNQTAAPAQPAQSAPPRPDEAAPPPNEGDDPEAQEAQIAAPDRQRPGTGPSHEFRSEKWAEIYGKRIEEMSAALKSTGVPVLWVGLPSIRGAKSTSDVIYLNNLYRTQAEKAGIVYIDTWDGFVDEGGRYALQGPDLEGQIRRLRTQDGVHFTKFGARKLAHYVEREIRRVMTVRVTPVALPATADPALPAGASAGRPSEPAARPLAGPVLPLNANVAAAEDLLGGAGGRPSGGDPVATRVLVKGEPIAAPAGRADDFAWPRRPPSASAPGPATPSVPIAATEPARTAPARSSGETAVPPSGASPSARRSTPNSTPREASREAPARPRPSQARRTAPPVQQEPGGLFSRSASPRGAIPDGLIPFFRPVR
jgi:hypothetical protein